jgi:hypothetical protein
MQLKQKQISTGKILRYFFKISSFAYNELADFKVVTQNVFFLILYLLLPCIQQ